MPDFHEEQREELIKATINKLEARLKENGFRALTPKDKENLSRDKKIQTLAQSAINTFTLEIETPIKETWGYGRELAYKYRDTLAGSIATSLAQEARNTKGVSIMMPQFSFAKLDINKVTKNIISEVKRFVYAKYDDIAQKLPEVTTEEITRNQRETLEQEKRNKRIAEKSYESQLRKQGDIEAADKIKLQHIKEDIDAKLAAASRSKKENRGVITNEKAVQKMIQDIPPKELIEALSQFALKTNDPKMIIYASSMASKGKLDLETCTTLRKANPKMFDELIKEVNDSQKKLVLLP